MIAVVLVVALAGGVWYGLPAGEPQTFAGPSAVVGDAGGRASLVAAITVYVSGSVRAPGLVKVFEGDRVADAIEAAGGATRDADLAVLNLAALLRDGEQVSVATRRFGAGTGGSSDAAADGKVWLNTASVEELQALPGVGPVLAARIAAHRDANGPFIAVEDLLDVTGIGEAKLASIRDVAIVP